MTRTGGGRNTCAGFAVGGGASGGACSPDTRLPPFFPEMENWSTPAKKQNTFDCRGSRKRTTQFSLHLGSLQKTIVNQNRHAPLTNKVALSLQALLLVVSFALFCCFSNGTSGHAALSTFLVSHHCGFHTRVLLALSQRGSLCLCPQLRQPLKSLLVQRLRFPSL